MQAPLGASESSPFWQVKRSAIRTIKGHAKDPLLQSGSCVGPASPQAHSNDPRSCAGAPTAFVGGMRLDSVHLDDTRGCLTAQARDSGSPLLSPKAIEVLAQVGLSSASAALPVGGLDAARSEHAELPADDLTSTFVPADSDGVADEELQDGLEDDVVNEECGEDATLLLARVCAEAEARSPLYSDVYPLQPDSRLMLQMVFQMRCELRARRPALAIEVGCGAAACALFLRRLLPSTAVLATDISVSAMHAALALEDALGPRPVRPAAPSRSAPPELSNLVWTDVPNMVRMDLASAVRPGTADLICLLPPYVPTSAEALAHAHASASASAVADTDAGGAHDRLRQFEVSSWTWAGGPLGTALLERFIGGDLLRVLAPRGLALLTVGLLASPDEIVDLVSRASRGALVARVAGGGDDHGHKIFCFRVERVS